MRKVLCLAFLLAMGLSIGCSTGVTEVGPAEAKEEKAPTMDEMYPPEYRKQMGAAEDGSGFTGEGANTNPATEETDKDGEGKEATEGK